MRRPDGRRVTFEDLLMFANLLFLANAETAAHGEGAQGLLEQFGIEPSFLIAQVISFSLLAFVLYRFGFKPILAAVDERQKKIESGLAYSDEMKKKLEQVQSESEAVLRKAALEAQAVVTDARKSAKELLEKQTQDAAAQGAAILEKARQSIELERKKMLVEVRSEIARLVTLTTARVLSKELSEDEKTRFANAASRELTNV